MILQNAVKFLETGIGVIPVAYKDKRPDFRLIQSWEPYKTELPSWDQVKQWFQSGLHNYGVIAGWRNLVVLDFDDMPEYSAWLGWAMAAGGQAQWTAHNAYRVATSRGVHVYIRLPHREKNRKLGKLDIKGDGYVLGPGSVHPSGAQYTELRATFDFPLVMALSDVLPTPLLLNTQPAAAAWTPTGPRPTRAAGTGLVKRVRDAYHVEDFFPQARNSGGGGRWMLTTCPLHDDHKPSFWIDTQRQICGCFSGCTPKPLDVINLYARMNGLANSEAIWVMRQAL